MTEEIPKLPDGWIAVQREELLRLQKEAQTDFLTELFNKGAFECEAKKRLSQPDFKCVLLLVDLDNFKAVNDRFGHLGGDRVLRAAADAIRSIFGPESISGRIGGDEFTVLLSEERIQAKQQAELLPGRMQALLDSSFSDLITVSVGIASFPEDAGDYECLFAAADGALYQAKHDGKARSVVYSAELTAEP